MIPLIRRYNSDKETTKVILIQLVKNERFGNLIEERVKKWEKEDWYYPERVLREIKLEEAGKPQKRKSPIHSKTFNQIQKEEESSFKIKIKLEEAIEDLGTNENIQSKEIANQHALPSQEIQKIQLKNIFGKTAEVTQKTRAMIQYDESKAMTGF